MSPNVQDTSAERIGLRLGHALRELDRAFVSAAHRVRERSDGEAVHDMRVAIRKIRVLLKLGREVYGRFLADHVRNEFTLLHRSTGALRDEEVLDETLASLTCDADDFRAWREKRNARRKMLRSQVERLASERRIATPRALLLALLVLPAKPERNIAVDAFARRALLRARRRVRTLAGAAVEDGAALHALRIAEKGLRYSIEPFAKALGPEAEPEAAHAAKCQKRLGEIHDLDVARAVVQRARTLSPPTREALLHELTDLRTRAAEKWLALGPIYRPTTEHHNVLSKDPSATRDASEAQPQPPSPLAPR